MQMKAIKKKKKVLRLQYLNNSYRKASATSIGELRQDWQQSLDYVYWDVNSR